MIREYIISSNIDVVGFHRGEIYVRFHSGGCYKYHGATLKDYFAMAKADSVGSHFYKHVRGKFPYCKLDYDPFILRKAA